MKDACGLRRDGRSRRDSATRSDAAPGPGTLPVDTPDLVQDGLEPNAMFVDRPQLDGGVGKGRGHLAQQRAKTRLEGGLRHGVGLHMAWARLEEACAQTP